MKQRWTVSTHMGAANRSKGVTPLHFGDARSEPLRSILVLRAWAIWRASVDGWAAGAPLHQSEFARIPSVTVTILLQELQIRFGICAHPDCKVITDTHMRRDVCNNFADIPSGDITRPCLQNDYFATVLPVVKQQAKQNTPVLGPRYFRSAPRRTSSESWSSSASRTCANMRFV